MENLEIEELGDAYTLTLGRHSADWWDGATNSYAFPIESVEIVDEIT